MVVILLKQLFMPQMLLFASLALPVGLLKNTLWFITLTPILLDIKYIMFSAVGPPCSALLCQWAYTVYQLILIGLIWVLYLQVQLRSSSCTVRPLGCDFWLKRFWLKEGRLVLNIRFRNFVLSNEAARTKRGSDLLYMGSLWAISSFTHFPLLQPFWAQRKHSVLFLHWLPLLFNLSLEVTSSGKTSLTSSDYKWLFGL